MRLKIHDIPIFVSRTKREQRLYDVAALANSAILTAYQNRFVRYNSELIWKQLSEPMQQAMDMAKMREADDASLALALKLWREYDKLHMKFKRSYPKYPLQEASLLDPEVAKLWERLRPEEL